MGLIINQPIADLSLQDILIHAKIALPSRPLPPVYIGGPVEINSAFFLYSADYKAGNFLEVSSTVRLSRDPQLLYDLAQNKGPINFIPTLGYSGWAPGQLENELTINGWLTLPGDDEIIFQVEDESKWAKAAMKYGIDIKLFGDVVGSA